jgi:hypothetical protein
MYNIYIGKYIKGEAKMSLFNKEGKEFSTMVAVDRDPTVDPTYRHKFVHWETMRRPFAGPRCCAQVRPIKSVTRFLQGCQLKRNQDYMIDFNARTDKYEYWFDDAQNAMMFGLMCGSMTQPLAGIGDIQCPHCAGVIDSHSIHWDASLNAIKII